eukprot:TRINITY_DN539_c0_g1_i1.p3 TRINITY_DN539_c0_g1~~TRINITY_DN539_c0_g1_i1.p3  ORF type:complete len:119 (-),score=9.35 TRINITY_DN539_c0_g1_i1:343-699(-)
MSDLGSIQNLKSPGADLFDSIDVGSSEASVARQSYIHVRVQQRNGRKSLTTVQGIKQTYDFKKILKSLKNTYCCNGTIVDDEDGGKVLQLQGDQRKNVVEFLTTNKLAKKESIKVHGF